MNSTEQKQGDWRDQRIWTIPNALSFGRLVGAFVAVGMLVAHWTQGFFWVVLAMLISDWIDGKLANWLNQHSSFGARVDSVADYAMYSAVLFGLGFGEDAIMATEWPWFVVAGVSFCAAILFGKWKFGRFPSYHTRSAKTAWLFATASIIALFGWHLLWPIRLTSIVVMIANLESIAITAVLNHAQTDVISIWRARQLAHAEPSTNKV